MTYEIIMHKRYDINVVSKLKNVQSIVMTTYILTKYIRNLLKSVHVLFFWKKVHLSGITHLFCHSKTVKCFGLVLKTKSDLTDVTILIDSNCPSTPPQHSSFCYQPSLLPQPIATFL